MRQWYYAWLRFLTCFPQILFCFILTCHIFCLTYRQHLPAGTEPSTVRASVRACVQATRKIYLLRQCEWERKSWPIARGDSPYLLKSLAPPVISSARTVLVSLNNNKKKRKSESIIVRYSLLKAGRQCQNVDGNKWLIKLSPRSFMIWM